MGLIRGVARTAAIAGTATAVSNRVSRRQGERWQTEQDAAAYQDQQYQQQAYQQAPPPPPPAAPAAPDTLTQLQQLGELHAAGVLTDEEFATQKAKILAQ
jgi:phosphoglycolate phosphatase-like HAD superfamily hydrolase